MLGRHSEKKFGKSSFFALEIFLNLNRFIWGTLNFGIENHDSLFKIANEQNLKFLVFFQPSKYCPVMLYEIKKKMRTVLFFINPMIQELILHSEYPHPCQIKAIDFAHLIFY